MPELMPGCEPWSCEDGEHGVLVCHGFTGNPQSMRPLAQAFADAGFSVELPLWPGHGTSVDDMAATTWDDWATAADAAYGKLAARCSKVVVIGLSMGGTLALRLAARHPEIAGIVLINPIVDPPAEPFREMLRASLEQGVDRIPGIGSDIADPSQRELAYDATPIAPLLSMMEPLDELRERLGDIRCPTLLFTSIQDHVVPTASSDVAAAALGGPVERVMLERSFHVAPLDYDAPEIERRSVDFARKVTAP